jgi:signal peptidase I
VASRAKGLNFYKKKKKLSSSTMREIGRYILLFVMAVLLAYFFVYAVGTKTSNIGSSMEPCLYNGQEVLINRVVYNMKNPARGDVVVFLPNGNEMNHDYIKRIIGLPGETITIAEGKVFINGEALSESETFDLMEDGGIAAKGLKLGDNEYFVLGDNRNNSEDSRSGNIGTVSKDYIIGRAWFHLGSGLNNRPGLIE